MKSNKILNYPEVDILLGATLRYYRKKVGLSQAEIAKRLDISTQQFQKYESGKNRLTVGRLMEISVILDIPIGSFFADTEKLYLRKKFREADESLKNLLYNYSLIRSEVLKNLLVQSSVIFVQHDL